MKLKIRKGDNVYILAGKDKGKTGIVKQVLIKKEKVIVEGIQIVKCFNKKKIAISGVSTKEMPIHVSNVAHVDPKTNQPVKVKVEFSGDKKLLVSKKTGEIIRVVVNYKKGEVNA